MRRRVYSEYRRSFLLARVFYSLFLTEALGAGERIRFFNVEVHVGVDGTNCQSTLLVLPVFSSIPTVDYIFILLAIQSESVRK